LNDVVTADVQHAARVIERGLAHWTDEIAGHKHPEA
jgi:hypothetical protein